MNSKIEKNNLNDGINIVSYTSNYYTFPSDGYLSLYGGGSSSIRCDVRSADERNRVSYNALNGQMNCVFVKKGMKTKVDSTSGSSYSVSFYPIV